MASSTALVRRLRSGDWIDPSRIRGYSVLLLAFFAVAILALWTTGGGLLDRWGRPIGTDFLDPYAAGRMALQGRAADAYDFGELHAVEQQISGQADNFYSWNYPPVFFLPAAALAALPYIAALLVWLAAGLALYLAAIRAILPERMAMLAACAFPAVYVTVGHGQNALLTAGLLGLGLALIDRRAFAAGLLLGCICYKPHLGLLIPVALVAGRQWRAIAGAALSVTLLCGLSVAAFGWQPWLAFLASETVTRTVLLEETATGWFKIQSLFSLVRGLGGSVATAYAAQAALALAVIAAIVWAWRRGPTPDAKAALCIGALLVTPYVLDYDMTAYGPALAFMAARGLHDGFRQWEKTVMAAAWIAPLAARVVAQATFVPLGLVAMLLLFAAALAPRPVAPAPLPRLHRTAQPLPSV